MIALLTDFGLDDIYVGVMKSAILSIKSDAQIVDLTHSIAPQNIEQGAFLLGAAWDYLPEGAIVVGVVDPGVGTQRRAVAVWAGTKVFVGPDNGLIGGLDVEEAVELTRPQFYLAPLISGTFHGRDIFAPVAAHIESGRKLSEVGALIDVSTLIRLSGRDVQQSESEIIGKVVLIDHFGNVVTDIPASAISHIAGTGQKINIAIGDYLETVSLVKSYGFGELQEMIATISSFGTLEIAVREGNAAEMLKAAKLGSKVNIQL